MKRVLAFVPCPPPYAGPEITTKALLDNLKLDKGCDICVIRSNVHDNNAEKGKLNFEGILNAGSAFFKFLIFCIRYRPNDVYFLLSSSKIGFLRDFFLICLSKICFCNVIAHYHGSNFKNFYKRKPLWYQWIIRFGLRHIRILIVQAENLKSVFSDIYPLSQIRVLSNGIPLEIINRLRREKEEETGELSLLFINHISFAKGFYDLILAFEEILLERNDVNLLIAGDLMLDSTTQSEFLSGRARQFYRENFNKIHDRILCFLENKIERVKYFGVVATKEKYGLYEASDVFVLPSYTEGFPTSMLEAMAFGIPLIVSPVGAIPEILKQEENALFVTPGDSKMLVSHMKRLLVNSSLRKKMGEANYNKVRQFYRMDIIQEHFSKILFH